jgi:hypothetical protein
MNVFLSWSGAKSKAVAEILKKYLPSMINQVEPWLSSQQIDAGARWSAEIAKNLEIIQHRYFLCHSRESECSLDSV